MNADLSTTDVLFIAGKPLNEPVVHYGPFVMNTHEETGINLICRCYFHS